MLKNLEDLINKNISPYYEINSEKYLKKYKKNLIAGNNDRLITNANIIIICIQWIKCYNYYEYKSN